MANEKKEKWFWKSVIKALVLIIALVVVAQILLGALTRHNKELSVPDFTNLTISQAEHLAAKSDMRIDITDSVFTKRIGRGVVYSQKPAAGSHVKKGRRILITINALQPKTVEMPNVVGYSLRQAKTVLASKGLNVGHLSYREDIATNNVLEQRMNGQIIKPGKSIETESSIDLLLGLDPANDRTYIPHLIGYSQDVAIDNIINNSLNVGTIRFDETVKDYTDSLNAVVCAQSPSSSSGESFPMGTAVNITLTTSQTKVATAK